MNCPLFKVILLLVTVLMLSILIVDFLWFQLRKLKETFQSPYFIVHVPLEVYGKWKLPIAINVAPIRFFIINLNKLQIHFVCVLLAPLFSFSWSPFSQGNILIRKLWLGLKPSRCLMLLESCADFICSLLALITIL